MAAQLLLFVFICAFVKNNAHALLQPRVSVNSLLITETDSVTVSCHTSSDIPVSQCDFYHSTLKISEGLCVQTLTGAELLQKIKKTSPAEVELKCSYSVKLDAINSTSPDSDSSTIMINNLLQPKLMVEPLEITETDPVTISCQLPPSVNLSTCYFEFSRQKPAKSFSCLKTLTGKELLSMAEQSSPSEVEVRCFYLDANQSPKSNISTVIIRIPRPELTGYPAVITEMDSVMLKCSTPSSFPVTGCYLKFMRTKVSQSISCDRYLGGVDLLFLAKQTSPAQVDLTCYYTVKHRGADQISPDSHILSIRIENMYEWTTTPMTVPFSVTTGVTSSPWSNTVSSTSASVTPRKPTPEASSPASTSGPTSSPWSGTLSSTSVSRKPTPEASSPASTSGPTSSPWSGTLSSTSVSRKPTPEASSPASTSGLTVSTLSDTVSSQSDPGTLMKQKAFWKWTVLPLSLGVTVGIILMGMTLFCSKRRSDKYFHQRPQPNHTGDSVDMWNIGRLLPAGNDETFTEVIFEPVADSPAEDHQYATIPDEPAALFWKKPSLWHQSDTLNEG
ncbi:flocculation protein FLO11-like isoform X2 [Salarias fasciatus]|uniref:flocculation protein FLO11-like isoform X2 n=1 Tax=Salarias fasciatus TaxID=181472 RepID=UPI001176691B|nr:flocculation protein FLO11-like isoform X2 [Salarias fasciatus]